MCNFPLNYFFYHRVSLLLYCQIAYCQIFFLVIYLQSCLDIFSFFLEEKKHVNGIVLCFQVIPFFTDYCKHQVLTKPFRSIKKIVYQINFSAWKFVVNTDKYTLKFRGILTGFVTLISDRIGQFLAYLFTNSKGNLSNGLFL